MGTDDNGMYVILYISLGEGRRSKNTQRPLLGPFS
jgi:hypothetical protein